MQQMMQHAPFMAALIRRPPRPAKTNAPGRGRMAGMSRDLANSVCRAFPGAEVPDRSGQPEDELRARLTQSCRLVRAGLPKKVQAGLGLLP